MTEEEAKAKYEGKWYLLNETDTKVRIMAVYLDKDTDDIKLVLGRSISIPKIGSGINEINVIALNNHFTLLSNIK